MIEPDRVRKKGTGKRVSLATTKDSVHLAINFDGSQGHGNSSYLNQFGQNRVQAKKRLVMVSNQPFASSINYGLESANIHRNSLEAGPISVPSTYETKYLAVSITQMCIFL